MRREHTQTSPEHLYRPPLNNYRSPYLSPSNDQRSFQSNKSPPPRIDDFEKRFPLSHKYDYPQPLVKSPPQKNFTSHQQPNPLQISQLKLTISQLRSSLQLSHDNEQRLQQQLFAERSKTYDLSQIRRRLEEELKRMQFQLDRLGNYQTLENRQSSIKLETLTREHSKLSQQVNDLLEEIKYLKQQHRKLMSECDVLLKEKHILMAENETLLTKLNNLENQVHDIKREVAQHSQQQIQSRINSVVTGRSQFVPTTQGSPRVGSKQSIQLDELPEEIDYEEENKKLMDDYQKLMVENASMKQLYQQFYKNTGNEGESQRKYVRNESKITENSKIPNISKPHYVTASEQKAIRSFSNKRLVQQLNSSEENIDNQIELMLKTSQKEQITQELTSVRNAAIGQLMKCYEKSLEQSQKEHKNSLKIFTQQISKKLPIFSKMSQNYLQMRATIQQDAKLVFPQSIKTLSPQDQKEETIIQIYNNVKQKAKGQAHIGLSLAIFRLLTLLHKVNPINPIISDNMKHSALKYIYKISRLPQTAPK